MCMVFTLFEFCFQKTNKRFLTIDCGMFLSKSIQLSTNFIIVQLLENMLCMF